MEVPLPERHVEVGGRPAGDRGFVQPRLSHDPATDPASITRDDEEAVWKTVHGARDAALQDEPRFALEVGDVVRIGQAKLFRKGYLPQWTEEWFRVRARDRGPPPTTVWKTSRARTWKDRFTSRSCRR